MHEYVGIVLVFCILHCCSYFNVISIFIDVIITSNTTKYVAHINMKIMPTSLLSNSGMNHYICPQVTLQGQIHGDSYFKDFGLRKEDCCIHVYT